MTSGSRHRIFVKKEDIMSHILRTVQIVFCGRYPTIPWTIPPIVVPSTEEKPSSTPFEQQSTPIVGADGEVEEEGGVMEEDEKGEMKCIENKKRKRTKIKTYLGIGDLLMLVSYFDYYIAIHLFISGY